MNEGNTWRWRENSYIEQRKKMDPTKLHYTDREHQHNKRIKP